MTSLARRRYRAAIIDAGWMLAWAAVVVGVALTLARAQLATIGLSLSWHLVVLGSVVLPVTIAATLAEASPFEATPGKLMAGVRVRTLAGAKLGWVRSLIRNLLKIGLPWALAQLGVVSMGSSDAWQAALGVAVAVGLPVVFGVGVASRSGRTVYDYLVGTTVIETQPGRRFAD